MKYIAYSLTIPLFTAFFSCHETDDVIVLPEGWGEIPGEYQGSISKTNKYPPHDQIY